MNADERLTALKKVYAEIILNTAKEAAARIMVSEQKSVRFQHELKVAKEESIRMLMRLKQMMDSKISEAELTSLSQQRKIEELEAQLQEAEDIVNDLRIELREVQDELERVSCIQEKELQNLQDQDTATPGEVPEQDRVVLPPESQEHSVTTSDMKVANMNQKIEDYQSCPIMVDIGHSYIANPDLPSIILRSKEPDLYRNGCTQRIRACEGNLLDRELSVSEDADKMKNENGVREDEGEGICSTPINNIYDIVNPEKKILQVDSWHLLKSFRRKRGRAVRSRKTKSHSLRNIPDHSLNMDKIPTTCCLRAHSAPARDIAPTEDPSGMTQKLSTGKAEQGVKLGFSETSEDKPGSVDSSGAHNGIDKREELMGKIDLPKEGTRSMESLEVSIDGADLEHVCNRLSNSESKVSDVNNEVPSLPLNDRVIKYTFHRKRKREPLSVSNENASIENSSSVENNGERLDGLLEPQKLKLVTESSRDSRRMAQVARQLISLSEKKWWQ